MYKTWIFEKTSPMGGATGQAFNTPLQGTLPPASILARESIQNSCDAAESKDEKVHVIFRSKKLLGGDKKEFFDTTGLSIHFSPRKSQLELFSTNCLAQEPDPAAPLNLLYIEDYNTYGLFGDPHMSNSHFHRLLLSLGDDAKAHDVGSTGGSFGFGKTVYSANSGVHTIIAYTSFDESRQEDGVTARLMGCAFLNKHIFDGQEYTGRAWLGEIRDQAGIVYPFENDEAHLIAKNLGFTSREGSNFGTSIMIIDCSIGIAELRKYIEEWWWPRICEDWLDVDFYENDVRHTPPRPKSREELRPFIECFDLALGRAEATGPHQKTQRLNKLKGKELGSFGYQTVDLDLAGNENMQDYVNCTALIRETRMVVAYENVGKANPPTVGVFVADKEIDHFLRWSEPATHDAWDPTTTRLNHAGVDAREYVKAVQDRIKQSFRKFQSESLPPQPPGEKRLKLFERDLGALFHPPTKDGIPPKGEAGPFSINFIRQPEIVHDDGKVMTSATFSISLRDDFENDKAEVILSTHISVLEDDNAAVGERLPIAVEVPGKDEILNFDGEATVPLILSKGEHPRISLRSDSYDPSWSTKITISVTPQKEIKEIEE